LPLHKVLHWAHRQLHIHAIAPSRFWIADVVEQLYRCCDSSILHPANRAMISVHGPPNPAASYKLALIFVADDGPLFFAPRRPLLVVEEALVPVSSISNAQDTIKKIISRELGQLTPQAPDRFQWTRNGSFLSKWPQDFQLKDCKKMWKSEDSISGSSGFPRSPEKSPSPNCTFPLEVNDLMLFLPINIQSYLSLFMPINDNIPFC